MGRQPSLRTLIAALATLAGCTPGARDAPADRPAADPSTTGDTAMTLTVTSPAFAAGATIPKRFTGDGEDFSPMLSWSGVPDRAKELALIMDDPDAPTPEPWVHWVIYKLPVSLAGLPENVAKSASLAAPTGAMQGRNSFNKVGYGGPAPPKGHGVHHYHFKLYALDAALNGHPGVTKPQLLTAMQGHIVAQGELMGTYERR